MRRLATFIMTLLMPIILIVSGGALGGWGMTKEWDIVTFMGLGMMGAGVLWGFFLWLWVTDGG